MCNKIESNILESTLKATKLTRERIDKVESVGDHDKPSDTHIKSQEMKTLTGSNETSLKNARLVSEKHTEYTKVDGVEHDFIELINYLGEVETEGASSESERENMANFYGKFLKEARPKQKMPLEIRNKSKTYWFLRCGRGFGKTWTGAHQAIIYCLTHPGCLFAAVAATNGDLEKLCLMESLAFCQTFQENLLSDTIQGITK